MTWPLSPASSCSTSTAVLAQRGDDAFGRLRLIAEKIGRADRSSRRPNQIFSVAASPGAGPGAARLGALALHRGVEALDIDADAAGAQRILRQIERKAVSVVELERDVAPASMPPVRRVARFVLEDRKAARQGDAEARLFEPQRLDDQRLGPHQFRIGLRPFRAPAPEQAATSAARGRRGSGHGAWRGA